MSKRGQGIATPMGRLFLPVQGEPGIAYELSQARIRKSSPPPRERKLSCPPDFPDARPFFPVSILHGAPGRRVCALTAAAYRLRAGDPGISDAVLNDEAHALSSPPPRFETSRLFFRDYLGAGLPGSETPSLHRLTATSPPRSRGIKHRKGEFWPVAYPLSSKSSRAFRHPWPGSNGRSLSGLNGFAWAVFGRAGSFFAAQAVFRAAGSFRPPCFPFAPRANLAAVEVRPRLRLMNVICPLNCPVLWRTLCSVSQE